MNAENLHTNKTTTTTNNSRRRTEMTTTMTMTRKERRKIERKTENAARTHSRIMRALVEEFGISRPHAMWIIVAATRVVAGDREVARDYALLTPEEASTKWDALRRMWHDEPEARSIMNSYRALIADGTEPRRNGLQRVIAALLLSNSVGFNEDMMRSYAQTLRRAIQNENFRASILTDGLRKISDATLEHREAVREALS